MSKQPTLKIIRDISGGDLEFEKKLITIIRKELPQEINFYNENCKEKNYLKIAGGVHKLTHIIKIFGLNEAYDTAVKFENDLRIGNCELKMEFDEILETMTVFLNSLEAPQK